jgi:hypothetical protein
MVRMEDPRYVTILPLVVRQLSLDLSLEVAGVGLTWSEVENEEAIGASARCGGMAWQRSRVQISLGPRIASDNSTARSASRSMRTSDHPPRGFSLTQPGTPSRQTSSPHV